MSDCGALAAWCGRVHEDRYAAAIEKLEDGIENCITEVGAIGIGIKTYAVELQDVEAVLVVSDQDPGSIIMTYFDFSEREIDVREWQDTHGPQTFWVALCIFVHGIVETPSELSSRT